MSVLAGIATWTLSGVAASPFTPYFGGVPPIVAVLAILALGIFALRHLQSNYGMRVLPHRMARSDVLTIVIFIALVGAAVITADLALRYPRDINVPWPSSLLFYPVMALVAEIVFHVVPLALLLFMLAVFMGVEKSRGYFVICLSLVALIEPAFQVSSAFASQSITTLDLFTALNVLVINIFLLRVFTQYGFITMFAVRLFYYLIWHIGWGHLRLNILF